MIEDVAKYYRPTTGSSVTGARSYAQSPIRLPSVAIMERDLPDKYKKRLVRKSKPVVPRRGASDAHLAMKIKQLFETLEAIDLDKGRMTPRSEQRALLTEIQKITEIKQKLSELSSNNVRSVAAD